MNYIPEWVNSYFLIIIVKYTEIAISVLGVLANISMFVIFFERNLRKLTFSIYFQALAVSGLYMNFTFSFQAYINMTLELQKSQVLCKLYPFLKNFSTTLFGWIQVVACIDQLILIFYPNIYRQLKKPLFKWSIFSLTLLYSVLSNNNFLVDSSIQNYGPFFSNCINKHYKINLYILLINSSIVPFVIMIVHNLHFGITFYVQLVFNKNIRMSFFNVLKNVTKIFKHHN